ncbi:MULTISPECIES: bifunctional protein tyrosine phosphatase family protein/NAD(P)/FAD-dependent oxidoreductase [Sphingomonadaceae]|jgi:sulfide:quinone oxidoreductase|uniref:bifunctional protein tyrosine phosphatase family protein/NAD(P)/FAD-dependent oxidoreductase n=1 Tax=Sphingomonadaceae TaxID=41297 RepID=UPI000F5EE2B4|nr:MULTISPECIES: bifunctional protein tyrosine phosphatase family protein/NAD(P)/FAD-dependent oxidoreductase [Sphingomonadaceae]RQW39428.1 TIGR01244 family phosphatase [Novosphingobium sp. LASN5T]RUN74657.1 TIGR01244 family phosphatase [Sphingomonas sp. TF3]
MTPKTLTPALRVSPQIAASDMAAIAASGVRSIICNRPDGEEAGQPTAASIAAAAEAHGLRFAHVPVAAGYGQGDVAAMARALAELPAPVLAYCRSGARSEQLATMAAAVGKGGDASTWDILVIGGGSAGIATAASILRRRPGIRLAIVEPSGDHYYQPGWTMVGGGIFAPEDTRREEAALIPAGVEWIRAAAASFDPANDRVVLADGRTLSYRVLVVCPGLKLDWDAIPGLPSALGQGGVTSNYRYDLAPYTNRLTREFRGGRALFTQPPMPIKCAGAPQKAMYLACHRWEREGVLDRARVQFHAATPALFGVAAYVPALEAYIARYGIDLQLRSRLVSIDGAAKVAVFEQTRGEEVRQVEEQYDMIHVVPPQVAPDFIAASPLAAPSGFLAVDEATLRHPGYANVFALGDVAATTNAKTAAAARKQAPVVAVNALAALDGAAPVAAYDGYGSCPLTVEAGRIVLAEFGYGGKLLPSFPKWLIEGTRPSRLSWLLKAKILPTVYWHGMLRGREWLAAPRPIGQTM